MRYALLVWEYVMLIFLISQFSLSAQHYTINGHVEDRTTGEMLLSAYVYDSLSLKGTSSNYYGFYSLTLPKGIVRIVCSYIGYVPEIKEFYLNSDTSIYFQLEPAQMLEEVVVTASKRNVAQNPQMSIIELNTKQIKQLPVFLGEADIMKTIQLLPGIKGGTEGTSGIYVRGGGPDQNLILLDGVPVYNINHLFGFFSIFNSDAIQSISVLKGGFPARYGGRLSSVMDIKMKEGNNKKVSGNISLGLISSKITLEGPIKDENTSFLFSARRTYFDLLLNLINNSDDLLGYYFYDVNAKLNHKFSDRSRIFYSFYNGLDKFYFKSNTNYDKRSTGSGWGNHIHALRWNYVLSNNLFANFTSTYSKYKFFINSTFREKQSDDYYLIEYSSGIRDWGFKGDFDFIPSPSHFIRFGVGYTNHHFNPGVNVFEMKYSDNEINFKIDTIFGNFGVNAHELALYGEDEVEITEKLKINIGLHLSIFHVKNQNYISLQPRISGRYLITNQWSIKASAVQMKQYIQLLTSTNIGLPSDLWVPSTNIIPPLESWQYAIGAAYSFNDNYEFTVDAYYKPMKNIIEYKEGASFMTFNNTWERKVEIGKGWGRGIEFLIRKKLGNINGWIGYTLSYADRQFENISFGKKFPYKYDRRHDIGVAINYHISDILDLGTTWVYGTGIAATLPTVQILDPIELYNNYPINNLMSYYNDGLHTIEYFPTRNNYRLPAYHRLDIAFNYHFPMKRAERSLSFGIYNTYMRQNPIFVDFSIEEDENGNLRRVLKQYSIFRIVPFVALNISF